MNRLPPAGASSRGEFRTPPQRWQFRLWHMFVVMTYVAVVAAAVQWWGTVTLSTTLGLGVLWLNFFGALTMLQKGKIQLVTLLVAWGMFLGSMFLPTHTEWAAEGWVAAWGALCMPLTIVRNHEWSNLAEFLGFWFFIDVANLSQLLLPLTAMRLKMNRGKILTAVNCLSMVSVWAIALPTAASGYILWCASFLLALAAMPVSRTILVAMHVILAGQLVFLWSGGHL